MLYLNATKVHGVISPAVYDKKASNSSPEDVSMSPKALQIITQVVERFLQDRLSDGC